MNAPNIVVCDWDSYLICILAIPLVLRLIEVFIEAYFPGYLNIDSRKSSFYKKSGFAKSDLYLRNIKNWFASPEFLTRYLLEVVLTIIMSWSIAMEAWLVLVALLAAYMTIYWERITTGQVLKGGNKRWLESLKRLAIIRNNITLLSTCLILLGAYLVSGSLRQPEFARNAGQCLVGNGGETCRLDTLVVHPPNLELHFTDSTLYRKSNDTITIYAPELQILLKEIKSRIEKPKGTSERCSWLLHLGIIGLVVVVVILAIYSKTRGSVLFFSAGALAIFSGEIIPNIELNSNISIYGDAYRSAKFKTSNTLQLGEPIKSGTFVSGYAEFENPQDSIELVKNVKEVVAFANSDSLFEVRVNGGVDKRRLKGSSKLENGNNNNLALARARYVANLIVNNAPESVHQELSRKLVIGEVGAEHLGKHVSKDQLALDRSVLVQPVWFSSVQSVEDKSTQADEDCCDSCWFECALKGLGLVSVMLGMIWPFVSVYFDSVKHESWFKENRERITILENFMNRKK